MCVYVRNRHRLITYTNSKPNERIPLLNHLWIQHTPPSSPHSALLSGHSTNTYVIKSGLGATITVAVKKVKQTKNFVPNVFTFFWFFIMRATFFYVFP